MDWLLLPFVLIAGALCYVDPTWPRLGIALILIWFWHEVRALDL